MAAGEQLGGDKDIYGELLARIPELPEAIDLLTVAAQASQLAGDEFALRDAEWLATTVFGGHGIAPRPIKEDRQAVRKRDEAFGACSEQIDNEYKARVKTVDIAVLAEAIADTEKLALVLSCWGANADVAGNFSPNYQAVIGFNEALQPGRSAIMLGRHQSKTVRPADTLFRVGEQSGFRLSISDNGHKVRVVTSRAKSAKIDQDYYGAYQTSYLGSSNNQTLFEFNPHIRETIPTLPPQVNSQGQAELLIGQIGEQELFPPNTNPGLALARSVAARHLGVSEVLPPEFDAQWQSKLHLAVELAVFNRTTNTTLEPDIPSSRYSYSYGQNGGIRVELSQESPAVLATVASMVGLDKAGLKALIQTELQNIMKGIKAGKMEPKYMVMHDICQVRLEPFLDRMFPAA